MRVLGDIVPSLQRPRVLLEATRAGRMLTEDLPELIAFTWLYDDSPTSTVTETEWMEIFEAAGFFSYPEGRSRPASEFTVYRAATSDRLRRMSWAEDPNVARVLGRRHASHGEAGLYSAIAGPSAVFAFLGRPGEGWTVVVDAARLKDIQIIQQLLDPHSVGPLAGHQPR